MFDMKLRAWDEMNRIMHHNFQFIKSGVEGNDWIVFISDKVKPTDYPHPLDNPYFSQQIKIDRWTGLYDKDGAEIYENDIIIKPGNIWGVVVWKAPYFELTVSAEQSSCYSREYYEDALVVGNTYQHKPEELFDLNTVVLK